MPSAKDAPLARAAVFLVEGESLFHTLALNLVPQEEVGLPLWERPPLKTQDIRGYATKWNLKGASLVYAWPSRGVLLLDEGSAVRWIAYGPGVEPVDVAWRDPMVAYRMVKERKGSKTAFVALRLSMDRSFWRDFAAMFPASGGIIPAVMEHRARLEEISLTASLRVLGQVSDQAKILDIRREAYPFPKEILTSEGFPLLEEALRLAEEVANGLTKVAWRSAREILGERDRSELSNFTQSLPLLRLYWHQLDLDFPGFLSRLAGEDALEFWRQRLRGAALRAWRETQRFVGTEARHLKALVEAEGSFAGVLAIIDQSQKQGEVKG